MTSDTPHKYFKIDDAAARLDRYRKGLRLRFYDEKRNRNASWMLNQLTVDELEFVRQFINEALDEALPLCQEADEVAKEDKKNGRPNPRNYRRVPKVVDHNWEE